MRIDPRIRARFRYQAGAGREYFEDKEIVGWTRDHARDAPVPWIMEDDRLRRASDFTNYVGLGYAEHPRVRAAVVPAQTGWFAVQRLKDQENRAWWNPVIAWAIADDNWSVIPVVTPMADDSSLRTVTDPDDEQVWFDATMNPNGGYGPWPEWPAPPGDETEEAP